MIPSHEHVEVILGQQGRLVIPAVLRKDLGLTPGTTMVARIEDNRLILEKPDAIWARIEGRFSPVPSTVHLADELIAERREMAKFVRPA
ncbi:AbrB/MazE/SpoVT family DNA-binding domain-containing protein [Acidithiobacillus sp.]|uniref:AbrB/MazE/SpoVT family DNA-binding domain-containing protein n=1 Tax=Acidithiobacillus sp. TaxID=1872118 RepID=UPI00260D217C|nr:AbrB/MazE/SpoVT family DNA-binding domain-containing protein [Acidithiobacillus sp.]MDD2748552.1 AbrB/MazE/SpoVT family DNA-binding domain-containing protein [Acidithiobacillus sp.]MDD5279301.1 AbrB/MazE/SpoVT family DNA-binding domain-containing protein [Acidithiobacillus sp.]